MGLLNSIRALLGGTPPQPAQRSAPMSPAPPTPKAQFTFRAEVVTEPHERSYLGPDDLARLLKPNADGLAPVHFIRRGDALWLAEDTTASSSIWTPVASDASASGASRCAGGVSTTAHIASAPPTLSGSRTIPTIPTMSPSRSTVT